MNLFEAINKRYSYRGEFIKEKLSDLDIEKILKAALAAPRAMNVQSTSYVAVTDENLINQLGTLINRNGTKTAPFILVMLSEDKSEKTNFNFEVENYSAACENILLAVTALGYATVWTDGILRNKELNDGVRQILNIPSGKTIKAVLPIGKPLTEGPYKEKSKIEEVVVFNKFK
ncbi:MAG: nitroreductase family protein [Pleomorphochaeta sp.]